MNIIKDNVSKFVKYLIVVLFALIVLYLFYLSGFSTSVIPVSEGIFLINDSFIVNLLFALLFFGILFGTYFIIKKLKCLNNLVCRINTDKNYYIKCRNLVLLVYFILLCVYLIAVQEEAITERLSLFKAADQWMNGDYSSLDSAGYTDFYPHQLGIILFLYIFSHIFGAYNYIAFQLFNALCITFTYKAFSELSDLSGNSNFTGLLICVLCVLFMPVALYSTFAYGTFIGLCFSVNAFKHIYTYHLKGKSVHAVISYCELLFAVIIKSNYLIFAIAYAVICFLLFCKKPSFKAALPVLISLCIIFFNKAFTGFIVGLITHKAVPTGLPTMSWIAMGLEENEKLFDGWWKDDFIQLFAGTAYDSTATHYISLERAQERVRYMLAEPGYAVRFFARKNAAQWNNPDFEVFFVNNVPTSIKNAAFFRWLLSAQGAAALTPIFNRMHFIVLFGTVLFLFTRDSRNEVSLFYCITVIGGFVFHTVWEGKSQYTLPYFMLLLPLSAVGYARTVHALANVSTLQAKKRVFYAACFAALLAFAGVIRLSSASGVGSIFCLDENTAEYERYAASLQEVRLEKGEYSFSSCVDSSGLSLDKSGDYFQVPITLSIKAPGSANIADIKIVNSEYGDGLYLWIDSDDGGRVLGVEPAQNDVDEDELPQSMLISAYKISDARALKWELVKADTDNAYYVVSGGRALTFDRDNAVPVLEGLSYSDEQKWVILSSETN